MALAWILGGALAVLVDDALANRKWMPSRGLVLLLEVPHHAHGLVDELLLSLLLLERKLLSLHLHEYFSFLLLPVEVLLLGPDSGLPALLLLLDDLLLTPEDSQTCLLRLPSLPLSNPLKFLLALSVLFHFSLDLLISVYLGGSWDESALLLG